MCEGCRLHARPDITCCAHIAGASNIGLCTLAVCCPLTVGEDDVLASLLHLSAFEVELSAYSVLGLPEVLVEQVWVQDLRARLGVMSDPKRLQAPQDTGCCFVGACS